MATTVSKIRILDADTGIPSTVDLAASGNILQSNNFQVVALDASKPLKLDADKKFISSYIVNGDVDAAAGIEESK